MPQDNWNVDDTDIPAKHYDSFCRFDFQTEMNKIVTYKKKEVPFIIYNMPALLEAKRRWSDIDYLNDRLGPYFPYPVDTSPNNHFMYAKVSACVSYVLLYVSSCFPLCLVHPS